MSLEAPAEEHVCRLPMLWLLDVGDRTQCRGCARWWVVEANPLGGRRWMPEGDIQPRRL